MDKEKKNTTSPPEDRNYFMEIGTEFAVDEDDLPRRRIDRPYLRDRLVWGLIGMLAGITLGLLLGLALR